MRLLVIHEKLLVEENGATVVVVVARTARPVRCGGEHLPQPQHPVLLSGVPPLHAAAPRARERRLALYLQLGVRAIVAQPPTFDLGGVQIHLVDADVAATGIEPVMGRELRDRAYRRTLVLVDPRLVPILF